MQFQPQGVSDVESATEFCKAKTREICINENGEVEASNDHKAAALDATPTTDV